MKKKKKMLRTAILAILILLLVLIVLINLYADRAVKWGIETAGTKTLAVGVKVDDVKLGIMSGTLELKKLIIDNPTEYQNPHMLELNTGKIQVKTSSLLSDVVRIKEIKLDGVDVVLEQKDVRGNNIQDILKNIPEKEPSGKKLHIDTLEISNIKVNVQLLPLPGRTGNIPLVLPPIKMTNLGNDNKLSTPQLVSNILVVITSSIAENGTGILPDDIIGPLNSQLKEVGQLSQSLLKQSQDLMKDADDISEDLKKTGEELDKGIKDITEGIKGLIKPKKEEN